MPQESLADEVYEKCRRVLEPAETTPGVRSRGGAAVGGLADLLFWNIVVAGVLHVSASLIAHAIWDRRHRREAAEKALDKLRQLKDESLLSPKGGTREVVKSAKDSMGELQRYLAGARPPADQAAIEEALAHARPEIQGILKAADPPLQDSERVAGDITEAVASSIVGCMGQGAE